MTIDRRTILGASLALAATAAPLPVRASASRSSFPKKFLWGAATSGHQIEGNNVNSDAWVLENVKPTVYSEPSGDAANSFELWPQDLDLVKALGFNCYRFSLEWPRIEPEPGHFSLAMLDHYKAIVDGCRKRGLTPFVTFNHYTTPRWFAARGGWTQPDAADLFARFCDRAARHLAAGIGYAATLNEPNLLRVVRNGLSAAQFAGFKAILDKMSEAAAHSVGSQRFVAGNTINVDDIDAFNKNLIAGHKAGRAAIKAARSDLPVGVTLAIPDDQPVGPNSIRDQVRARTYGAWLEAVRGDDFLGVQNYERVFWDAKGKAEGHPTGDRNAAGEGVYPDSLANSVRYAHSVAKIPIIVTEHGVNSEDDAVRARLIPAALAELKKAIDDGIPVKGYLHWSLLDNFEWIFGYKYRYGLIAFDRSTFKRSPKPSASVLGGIARRNAIR